MPQRIEISYKTIIFTIMFLIALWFVLQIWDIILLVFLSFIAASGLRYPVDMLVGRFRLPRIFAIIIMYVILIILFSLFVSTMIPAVIAQTNRLLEKLSYFFSVSGFPLIDLSSLQLSNQLSNIGGNIFKVTVGAFSAVVNFSTFLVLSFYMLLERRHMRVLLKNVFGEQMKDKIVDTVLKIELRLGEWVRGEAVLMLVIGVFTYIGLTLLRVEYALPLAILAGLLEIIPVIGPIISAIPAVIITLIISPWLALATAALYFLVQQLENHLIVPFVMKQAVGLPPMITIVSILIGGRLAGFVGALLSVPFVLCVQILFQEWVRMKESIELQKTK